MSLKSFWLNLLFPIKCLNCQQEGVWLCTTCFKNLKFNNKNKKYQLIIPNLNQIFIAGDYNNPLLALTIKKFKYNFISELGPILARFLIIFWQKLITDYPNLLNHLESEDPIPLLIPIPLSKKRERRRGFNQAEILARELGKILTYPLNLKLKRRESKKSQTSLNEKKRLQNIQGVFTWTGKNLSNQTIILIDDVITTGATLNEAARILRLAGANKIYGLTLAKG